MMLYHTLKRMIQRGQTEGMEEKLDVFYAADKLTGEEYAELTALLHPECETRMGNGTGAARAGAEEVNRDE